MGTPRTWTIHNDVETISWRKQLVERFPLVSPHRLLRLCLRYGMRLAVQRPEILVEEAKNSLVTEDRRPQ